MCYNKTILKTKYNIILLHGSVFLVREERGKRKEQSWTHLTHLARLTHLTHLTRLTHLTQLRIVSKFSSEGDWVGHFFVFLFLRFESLLS